MVKLTINEGKIRKILMKHPHGIKARALIKESFISRTPLYRTLNGLEEKKFAFRGGHGLWYPENPLRECVDLDSSSEKQVIGFGFFDWLRERSEKKAEQREKKSRERKVRMEIIRARHEAQRKGESWDINKRYKIERKARKHLQS